MNNNNHNKGTGKVKDVNQRPTNHMPVQYYIPRPQSDTAFITSNHGYSQISQPMRRVTNYQQQMPVQYLNRGETNQTQQRQVPIMNYSTPEGRMMINNRIGNIRPVPIGRNIQNPPQQMDRMAPVVDKIGGRARILRPQHIPEKVQPQRGLMMTPVKDTRRSMEPAKNAISIDIWVENTRRVLARMRKRYSDMLNIVTSKPMTQQTCDMLTEMGKKMDKDFTNLEIWVRRPTAKIGSLRAAISRYEEILFCEKEGMVPDLSYQLTEQLMLKRYLEYNVIQTQNCFRESEANQPARKSYFATLSPVVKHDPKTFQINLEFLRAKSNNEPMSWKFERVKHLNFLHSRMLYEVKYTTKQIESSKSEAVTQMKALMVISFSELIDIVVGSSEEQLYDEDGIHPSKHACYRKITVNIRNHIMHKNIVNFRNITMFVLCNNYIQKYVQCFSTKCHYCKKYLRNLGPPTMVNFDFKSMSNIALICHDDCYKTNP